MLLGAAMAGCSDEGAGGPASTVVATSASTSSRAPLTSPAPTSTIARSTVAPPTATPSTISPPPSFTASVIPVPPDVRATMTGRSWRPGCPVGLDDLRLVVVSHWDLGGGVRTGRLVLHRDHAEAVVAVFEQLFAVGFPLEQVELIDAFDGDDDASMAANNTSAFNCRRVSGTSTWSEHAYGRAIDINPRLNPWVRGSQVDPPNGAEYADRSRQDPGMIHAGDAVVSAFASIGWTWGGTFTRARDYQHFSATGR